mmetsp:Transcript_33132/g.69333  ORF Transcript_33132/g.69333 Transcript_33132/m.69333 type:complete len:216 (-) Transcript_33132:3767-4414(-)
MGRDRPAEQPEAAGPPSLAAGAGRADSDRRRVGLAGDAGVVRDRDSDGLSAQPGKDLRWERQRVVAQEGDGFERGSLKRGLGDLRERVVREAELCEGRETGKVPPGQGGELIVGHEELGEAGEAAGSEILGDGHQKVVVQVQHLQGRQICEDPFGYVCDLIHLQVEPDEAVEADKGPWNQLGQFAVSYVKECQVWQIQKRIGMEGQLIASEIQFS